MCMMWHNDLTSDGNIWHNDKHMHTLPATTEDTNNKESQATQDAADTTAGSGLHDANCCASFIFGEGCDPLNKSQKKQWGILQMIRDTQMNFENRAEAYSDMGDCKVNRPTCKKVAEAYEICAKELNLILSVIETIH